ncbi:unnamed protein product [Fraxinus pennsylvanica]|uniref:ceramidase n=1 Tax=Fraxinus pennsylvanica TaxID=56036 RepID=A0AAD1Z0E5_9LAMI|nr:unnamed protein product [Fraxinus pennsylvanica]
MVSGDNKGAAARFTEDWFDQNSGGKILSGVSKAEETPLTASNIIPVVHDNLKQILVAFLGMEIFTRKVICYCVIHTHSGLVGYLRLVIYIVTSLSFVHQSFDVLVHDIEQSIVNAHNNLRPGSGASTLFDPHTVNAYIQEVKKLAAALISGPVQSEPQPLDLLDKQISLLMPVVMDATPPGVNFGDVSSDVPKNSTFKRGDNITVAFLSVNPRNDLMTEGKFAL